MTGQGGHPALDRACGFPASRDAALARLERFAPRAGRRYAETRNYDYGPNQRVNVSMLSPYLRHRLIGEREVLQTTLDHHSSAAAEKFVQEVFWRAYFKGWLEHHPGVWQRYVADVDQLTDRLHDDSALARSYDAAVGGQTGIDCLDAWATELQDTGYLHNHARMWFASIWVYTLKLPWQLGADFFYRHLLDGDPASNTLSWRWVCGLHTRGKTYLARASNIRRYTEQRFDPVGLADAAPPLDEDRPAERVPLVEATTSLPDGDFGLLITEEDCWPETLLAHRRPSAALALDHDSRSPLPVGEAARSFTNAALDDALARVRRLHGVPVERRTAADWVETLLDWSKATGVERLVTAAPACGPVFDRLSEARPTLAAGGVSLDLLRREYDRLCWPHAARGFFRLRKQIPDLLATLGLR